MPRRRKRSDRELALRVAVLVIQLIRLILEILSNGLPW